MGGPDSSSPPPLPRKPILIVGAGISGLLLAQHLRKVAGAAVPVRLFERDADLDTRGLGWGLTLHWSLPALRALLPAELVRRLPEAYVDRVAVAEGRPSTFPFYDLSTGELRAKTPAAPEALRIRVTRDRLRRVLATGLDIEWGKAVNNVQTSPDDGTVTLTFDDGTSCEGSLAVACDGGSSRIRALLFPDHRKHRIPVRLMGVKVDCTPDEIEPLRRLDPYFLQGAASQNDSFSYFSVLDAPGNYPSGDDGNNGKYTCQMVVSWPVRRGFLGQAAPTAFPASDAEGVALLQRIAETWAEPFRSLARGVPRDTEVKCLELYDWPPPRGLGVQGRVVLVGDALHPMAMYRGEGANHAILDVLDLAELVLPHFLPADPPAPPGTEPAAPSPPTPASAPAASHGRGGSGNTTRTGSQDDDTLEEAIARYQEKVISRARPAVLASRQAALDAHCWSRISEASPLLTRRAMEVAFEEGDLVEEEAVDWEGVAVVG